MKKLKEIKDGFLFEPRTIAYIGDGWAFYIKLCKDIDGRWQQNGVNLPVFGSSNELKQRVTVYANESIVRTDQRIRRWWMPYLVFYWARNVFEQCIIPYKG